MKEMDMYNLYGHIKLVNIDTQFLIPIFTINISNFVFVQELDQYFIIREFKMIDDIENIEIIKSKKIHKCTENDFGLISLIVKGELYEYTIQEILKNKFEWEPLLDSHPITKYSFLKLRGEDTDVIKEEIVKIADKNFKKSDKKTNWINDETESFLDQNNFWSIAYKEDTFDYIVNINEIDLFDIDNIIDFLDYNAKYVLNTNYKQSRDYFKLWLVCLNLEQLNERLYITTLKIFRNSINSNINNNFKILILTYLLERNNLITGYENQIVEILSDIITYNKNLILQIFYKKEIIEYIYAIMEKNEMYEDIVLMKKLISDFTE